MRIKAFIAKLLRDLENRNLFYYMNKTIMASSPHSRDFLVRRTLALIVCKGTIMRDITNVRRIGHFVEPAASKTAPIFWKPCRTVAKLAIDAMVVFDNFSVNVTINNISSKIVNKETSLNPLCVKPSNAAKHVSN